MSRSMHILFLVATAIAVFCVWVMGDTLVNHQPQTLSREDLESGAWMLYAVCGALTLKMIWKWVCTVRQVYFGKKPTREE